MSRSYYLSREEKWSRPLGTHQIATLRQFRRNATLKGQGYIPMRNGDPWPVLKSLIRRGLMWSRKERCRHWMGDKGWSRETRYSCYAGLTVDGEGAIMDIDFQEAKEENAA